MEDRKQRERDFHDEFRADLQASGDSKYTAYRKWYAAGYAGKEWMLGWLRQRAGGRRVLDYACGSGDVSIELAKMGAQATGIDVSAASIALARDKAAEAGVAPDFRVMDAEHTDFESGTFDIVVCSGVLHHMDLLKAYAEIARVLKPRGVVIAWEALGHNPLINWYRKRTPYLRSPDEHPLLVRDLELAHYFFDSVRIRYFGLAALAAAPLWKTPLVRPTAQLLGLVDDVLLQLPVIQRQAWTAGILLSRPKTSQSAHHHH